MDIIPDPRPSRLITRSLSYSSAIGDQSRRSSIQIPLMKETEVYTNEEKKKHYRISQTYVEGREIAFNTDGKDMYAAGVHDIATDSSQYNSEEDIIDEGLTLSIDIEKQNTSNKTTPRQFSEASTSNTNSTRQFSDASTRAIATSSIPSDVLSSSIPEYDRIDVMDSVFGDYDTRESVPSGSMNGYMMHSTYRGTRRRKGTTHRHRRPGRPTRSRRCVLKDGEENVPLRSHIPAKSIKYMRDLVNTVINSKWRFIILLMFLAHWAFWLFFAGIWYAVSQSYADDIGDGRQHCVNGTSSYAGMLMMSVETQMTIGYGVRFPNEECPEAIIVMVIEIIAGTALSGGLSSLLFTKLVRPNRHVSSVGFSKKAAVCLRDGELVIQFRVWDLLNIHLVGTSVSAYIMKPIRTLEGELVPNYIHQLKLKQYNALLLWPITVVHVIDEESPLYDFSAEDMMEYRFELVVSLTGSSKSMGTVTQSRTSYLSKEIIWGYRFRNVLHYSKTEEAYVIDVDHLDTVDQVQTPLCSAARWREVGEEIRSQHTLTPNSMDSNTYKETPDSVPSTPSMSLKRNGTGTGSQRSYGTGTGSQRSYGWNYKRFYYKRETDMGARQ